MREPIKLPRERMIDFVSAYSHDGSPGWLMNIRGTNGSGKSTLPLMLLEQEPNPVVLTLPDNTAKRYKESACAMYMPSFNIAVCGTYFNKTGGLDVIGGNAVTRLLVELLWNSGANTIMEGVIASTITSTYVELFTELARDKANGKKIIVHSLLPPVEVCINRVIQRNGGNTEIKTELIEGKWRSVNKSQHAFAACPYVKALAIDNTDWNIQETIDRYKGVLGQMGVSMF